jgi:hypothetical protein
MEVMAALHPCDGASMSLRGTGKRADWKASIVVAERQSRSMEAIGWWTKE